MFMTILTWVCVAGFATLLAALAVIRLHQAGVYPVRYVFTRFRRQHPLVQVFLL